MFKCCQKSYTQVHTTHDYDSSDSESQKLDFAHLESFKYQILAHLESLESLNLHEKMFGSTAGHG